MAFTHSLRSASGTIDCKDYDVVIVTATTATVNLPDPTSVPVGSRRIVKKTSATGTVTVQSMGAGQVDNAASFSLAAQK